MKIKIKNWVALCTVLALALLVSCEQKPTKSKITISPPLQEDIVSVGMTQDEVISKLGKPARVLDQNDKDEIMAWVYWECEENLKEGFQLGGLQIFFKDRKVFKVLPITVNKRSFP